MRSEAKDIMSLDKIGGINCHISLIESQYWKNSNIEVYNFIKYMK